MHHTSLRTGACRGGTLDAALLHARARHCSRGAEHRAECAKVGGVRIFAPHADQFQKVQTLVQ
jgi:hypothetical protein